MPTPEQVKEWRVLRGRFLNALWDAEHRGVDFARVSDLLEDSGAPGLPDHLVERLVTNLSDDGLIEGMGYAEAAANQVRLTSDGRYELEQWIGEPDEPTEHLPVPAAQIFNIGSMTVTGPVLQGAAAANVVMSYGASDDALRTIIMEFRRLLTTVELREDEREAVEADLSVIEDEAATPQPRPERLRPLLRRLRATVLTGALIGVEAGAKQQVVNLIDATHQALT